MRMDSNSLCLQLVTNCGLYDPSKLLKNCYCLDQMTNLHLVNFFHPHLILLEVPLRFSSQNVEDLQVDFCLKIDLYQSLMLMFYTWLNNLLSFKTIFRNFLPPKYPLHRNDRHPQNTKFAASDVTYY
jgi:hypothetical protein